MASKEAEKYYNEYMNTTDFSNPDSFEEPSAPKYRPFKDCSELIEFYIRNKQSSSYVNSATELPTIWVQNKDNPNRKRLLQFDGVDVVMTTPNITEYVGMYTLFKHWEFLDGTPCGVEE